jgi:hypothetical protein
MVAAIFLPGLDAPALENDSVVGEERKHRRAVARLQRVVEPGDRRGDGGRITALGLRQSGRRRR